MTTLVDFYPTPRPLIERMLRGVPLSEARHVLEPSAGKGDIADAVNARGDDEHRFYRRTPKVDVIEIDPDLQLVLRGKGYNLVHDDFLTFETSKHYDLIIANFPFSAGDAHLQRALALLERTGGTLVCLVNAETLRNPYTALRRMLRTQLEKHGCAIEYISGAFENAERHTDVEIALVRATFPRPHQDSILLEDLRAAAPLERDSWSGDAIVDGDPVAALVARYNFEARVGVRLIDEYFALLPHIAPTPRVSRSRPDEAPSDAADTFGGSGLIKLTISGRSSRGDEVGDPASGVNGYLEALREKYWALLIHNEAFSRAYTSNVLKELHGRMDELKGRDFSIFNVRALEAELRTHIRAGVEKAILDLFDTLSRKFWYGDKDQENGNVHYYNGWKTNRAHKINSRVVIPMNGISADFSGKMRFDYRIGEELSDIVKVFRYLEGDDVNPSSVVAEASRIAEATQSFRSVDLHYFEASFFKKRTCHIHFTNQRLLDKFNIFGAQRRGWLPPSYGKKAYSDMDQEERACVDSFQGPVAYAAVVADRDYLIVDDVLALAAGPGSELS